MQEMLGYGSQGRQEAHEMSEGSSQEGEVDDRVGNIAGRGHVWRVNPEGRELWERGYSMGGSEGVRGLPGELSALGSAGVPEGVGSGRRQRGSQTV